MISTKAGISKNGAKTTKSTKTSKSSASENLIKEIRRNTKRIFNSEQKVIIVMEGIRGELSITELCRKYAISTQTYYTWNKEFIEAGKRQLSGDVYFGRGEKILEQRQILKQEALTERRNLYQKQKINLLTNFTPNPIPNPCI